MNVWPVSALPPGVGGTATRLIQPASYGARQLFAMAGRIRFGPREFRIRWSPTIARSESRGAPGGGWLPAVQATAAPACGQALNGSRPRPPPPALQLGCRARRRPVRARSVQLSGSEALLVRFPVAMLPRPMAGNRHVGCAIGDREQDADPLSRCRDGCCPERMQTDNLRLRTIIRRWTALSGPGLRAPSSSAPPPAGSRRQRRTRQPWHGLARLFAPFVRPALLLTFHLNGGSS
jgi:hypothetical protein